MKKYFVILVTIICLFLSIDNIKALTCRYGDDNLKVTFVINKDGSAKRARVSGANESKFSDEPVENWKKTYLDGVTFTGKDYYEKNYKHYNVTTKSNYLYMIRETGGFMTGAYVDSSNPDKVGVNPYYDSNIGNESYLLELGYISNSTDVNTLKEEQDALAKAISDSIIKEINEKM